MGGITLDRLAPYRAGTVESVEECAAKQRLCDLGVTPGAEIVRLFDAPGGEPTAYLIRGAVIGLRVSDSSHIRVKGL